MSHPPRDLAELEAQYDHFITGCILRMARRRLSNEDLEDLKQQVLLRALHAGAIEKYDPSRATRFTTYLYCVIRTVVHGLFERNQKDPLTHAVRAVETAEQFEPSAVVLETLADLQPDAPAERELIAEDFNNKFEAYLRTIPLHRYSTYCNTVVTLPDGSRYPHGFALVFHLLRKEYTSAEIGRLIGMTPSNVRCYVVRIEQEARRFLSERPTLASV